MSTKKRLYIENITIRLITFRYFYSLSVGVGAVAAAPAAAPTLPPAASATVGPPRFRTGNPPGHRQGGRSGGLWLAGDDAVDPPPTSGRCTGDQDASLVLDEAGNVLVGG